MDEDGIPHLHIILPGPFPREEIELSTTVSQLLFEIDREAYKVVLNACLEAKATAPQDAEVA